MSGTLLEKNDDKTVILPDPQEHRRQRKIARRQHITRTLRRLRDSNNLFPNYSITLAEDERTIMAKANKSNKKRMAIKAAHTKRGTTNIGFAQRGRNTAYSLGSAFNQTIKQSTSTHASFPATTSVHKYINNEQPIMVTYNF